MIEIRLDRKGKIGEKELYLTLHTRDKPKIEIDAWEYEDDIFSGEPRGDVHCKVHDNIKQAMREYLEHCEKNWEQVDLNITVIGENGSYRVTFDEEGNISVVMSVKISEVKKLLQEVIKEKEDELKKIIRFKRYWRE